MNKASPSVPRIIAKPLALLPRRPARLPVEMALNRMFATPLTDGDLDFLDGHTITISVGEETRSLYDQIVSNTGSTDADVEVYLRQALRHLLKDKVRAMQELEESL